LAFLLFSSVVVVASPGQERFACMIGPESSFDGMTPFHDNRFAPFFSRTVRSSGRPHVLSFVSPLVQSRLTPCFLSHREICDVELRLRSLWPRLSPSLTLPYFFPSPPSHLLQLSPTIAGQPLPFFYVTSCSFLRHSEISLPPRACSFHFASRLSPIRLPTLSSRTSFLKDPDSVNLTPPHS